ncbi:MAG: VWA domain-containing protein [Xanthomonadales bacterium]
MSEFTLLHFIRPSWLLLLPLAVFLPWLWKRTRRPAGDWMTVCDPHLLRWLSVSQAGGKARAGGRWLAGTAVLISILALAGPSWQKLPDRSFSARDARMIVLDLSRSMLAQDLRPNRLTRARFRLADLLEMTEEGQVGLVAYAGDAYAVSPLTSDMNTIANLLPALRPDIVPVSGSRADRGLAMAASLLGRAGLSRGEILLVTDSADSADAARARDLRNDGIITSVLAVGTVDGAPIPSGAGFISDRSGNVVIARLDRASLQAVAEAGGGRYMELGAYAAATSLWLESDGSEFARRDGALGERWKDAGPWLVLLLLPLALLGFRRGLLFILPLVLLPGLSWAPAVSADWWDDTWQRKDQQAYQALQADDAEKAAALAVDPALSGQAWYRSGEHANAVEAWSQLDAADAHYNRGNALAHLGEYEAAINAYDEALAIEPEMEDALMNRALLEQMKQQQEQQQQGEEGESGESEPSEDQSERDSAQQSEGEGGEEGEQSDQQDGEQQEGDQREGESGEENSESVDYSEAWSEEDAQAMEQWLRRIPDDPGGLLRRKFRNQHQRRGAPKDETETW